MRSRSVVGRLRRGQQPEHRPGGRTDLLPPAPFGQLGMVEYPGGTVQPGVPEAGRPGGLPALGQRAVARRLLLRPVRLPIEKNNILIIENRETD
jgi:hypothetical protein